MAIDTSKLTEADRGRWVGYIFLVPPRPGRIQEWKRNRIRVVYERNCKHDWNNWDQYKGSWTDALSLKFIEPPDMELF